jgi:hypothetical protein
MYGVNNNVKLVSYIYPDYLSSNIYRSWEPGFTYVRLGLISMHEVVCVESQRRSDYYPPNRAVHKACPAALPKLKSLSLSFMILL